MEVGTGMDVVSLGETMILFSPEETGQLRYNRNYIFQGSRGRNQYTDRPGEAWLSNRLDEQSW